jgi:putative endonuclease
MAPRSAVDRKKALRRGHVSEYFAAFALMLRGYRIVAMRYRVKSGEIDIIARKGDVISFVEVKARATTEASVFAVDGSTQNRIRNASTFWLSTRKDAGSLSYSYDIVAVRPWRWPIHLKDAF